MFGLREWEEEGFVPQAQDADDPSYDPVQTVRKARQPSARVTPPSARPALPLPLPPSLHPASAAKSSSVLLSVVAVQSTHAQYHTWALPATPRPPAKR